MKPIDGIKSGRPGRDFVASCAKGLLLLSRFTRHQPAMTLSEVARVNGLNLPTARRYLNTLKQMGFVFYDNQTKRYRLTAKILCLGGWVLESMDLRTRLLPYMSRITNEMDITALCAIIEGGELVTIERTRSTDVVNLDLTAGSRLPIHATSLGKAIAAFLSPAELDVLIWQLDFSRYTPNTKTDPEQFRCELSHIRQCRYAVTDQELTIGMKSIAVPIFDKNGKVEASFGVSYPCHRPKTDELERVLIERLLDISVETSKTIMPLPENQQRNLSEGEV